MDDIDLSQYEGSPHADILRAVLAQRMQQARQSALGGGALPGGNLELADRIKRRKQWNAAAVSSPVAPDYWRRFGTQAQSRLAPPDEAPQDTPEDAFRQARMIAMGPLSGYPSETTGSAAEKRKVQHDAAMARLAEMRREIGMPNGSDSAVRREYARATGESKRDARWQRRLDSIKQYGLAQAEPELEALRIQHQPSAIDKLHTAQANAINQSLQQPQQPMGPPSEPAATPAAPQPAAPALGGVRVHRPNLASDFNDVLRGLPPSSYRRKEQQAKAKGKKPRIYPFQPDMTDAGLPLQM